MTAARRIDAVDDAELFWRRVHRSQYVPDGVGGMKVSSAAFTHKEMSVDRAWIVREEGGGLATTMQEGAGVAQFEAQLARRLEQEVRPDPIPANNAHALVIGEKQKPAKRVAKAFATSVTFLTPGEGTGP